MSWYQLFPALMFGTVSVSFFHSPAFVLSGLTARAPLSNIMQTMTVEEAETRRAKLIEAVASGEEVVIRKDDGFFMQLVPCPVKRRKRVFGSAKGLISMAPDFDKPLEDFKECLN